MIKTASPLPFIGKDQAISDGSVFPAARICRECVSRPCVSEYNNKRLGELQRCVNGVDYCYVVDDFNDEVVWCGLIVKGRKYDGYKKLAGRSLILENDVFENVLRSFSRNGVLKNILRDVHSTSESQALHDLKHLIGIMQHIVKRREVEAATKTEMPNEEQVQVLKKTVDDVYNVLGAVHNQIQMSDFIIAPDIVKHEEDMEIDVYSLLYKSKLIYQVLARQYGKWIHMEPPRKFIDGKRTLSPTFGLLPHILLQNAIKYSVDGATIYVRCWERFGRIAFDVKSYGPIVPNSEARQIWSYGGQYVHENDTPKPGSGFGLYLAREICRLSNFEISYDYGEPVRGEGDVPVGWNTFLVRELGG